ncbi:hypothetical protein MPSEU_000180100 [Mayamaea pseudoterrestris]|nr:hypothetical protein MPSEU_000180100 [Mayamaea pseudoterrestris]
MKSHCQILWKSAALLCLVRSCQSFAGVETASLFIANLRDTPSIFSNEGHPCRTKCMFTLSMTATSNNKSSSRTKRQQSKPSRSAAAASNDISTTAQNNNNNDYILQDEHGSINRELAEQFYVWEQAKRRRNHLEPLDFSMRSGLRWVQEAAMKEIAGATSISSNSRMQQKNHQQQQQQQQQSSSLYSDLVQEGLSALLQAMSTYDTSHEQTSWEHYAKAHIRKAMTKSLEQEQHLIWIPQAVQRVVQQARMVHKALLRKLESTQKQDESTSKPVVVTLEMVAKRLNMNVNELQDYLQWYSRYANTKSRSVVSLESTVEISHPTLDDSDPHFVDIDDWEWKQGYHRDILHDVNGKSRSAKSGKRSKSENDDEKDDAMDILEYLDDYRETEGDDDAWIQEHEQVAGLLQDVIPDKEEQNDSVLEGSTSLDDDVLAEVIRENLGSFLQTNLSPDELTIVQMTFGLEGRQPASFRQMASELKLQDKADAVQLLERALDKLRTAFRLRYLEPQDDSDDDDLWTESV